MLTTTQNLFTKIFRWYFRLTGKNPADMEMVSYWKTKESVQAKVTKSEDGSTVMYMEGEKYPFPGFPRSAVLFGALSKMKHEIKTQIFNESWRKLEEGVERGAVIEDIKKILKEGLKVKDLSTLNYRKYTAGEDCFEILRYDLMPPYAMCPAVREIHRAWTKVSPETGQIRDMLCLILQEDDAYRFRVQWLFEWFIWLMRLNPVRSLDFALGMLEHGEVVSDMKERMRLLRRVVMLALEDPGIRTRFVALFREIDWQKVKLGKGDKYHFRGKHFKVDLKYLEY